MANINQSSSRFSNLDAIRGIGVTIMFVAHIEALKKYAAISNYFHVFSEYRIGYITLVVFFVLSGFLITYILLNEKKNSGTVSVSGFYKKRIKRLWPVYYFVLLLALFVLPGIGFFTLQTDGSLQILNLSDRFPVLLFFLHMPDVVFVNQVYQFIGQFWSIGIEEKFYFIWPIVLKYSKNIFTSMLVLLSAVILFKAAAFASTKFWPGSSVLSFLNRYSFSFMVDSMIVGGLMAYFLFIKHPVLNILYKCSVQVFALMLGGFLLFMSVFYGFTSYVLFAVPIAVVILNMASNPDSLITLNVPVLNYIGKISYGMYMYSIIIIVFFLSISGKIPFEKGGIMFNVFLYSSSYVSAIVVSSLSYFFLEKKIMQTKRVNG